MIAWLRQGLPGYPALFLACATSGILFPVPEDVPLLYAGMRIQSGDASWAATLLVACSGVLLRDLVAYALGRVVGGWLISRPLVIRIIGARRLGRALRLVEQRGSTAVLAGRFFVGMRAPIFLVAGAMGVSARRFLLWDLLGLVVVVPLAIGLGHAFGAPLAESALWLLERTRLVALVVLVGGIGLAWWRWRTRVALAFAGSPDPEDDDS